MNYENMSDFEINVRIAEMFGVYWNISPDKSESGQWEYCKNSDICNKNAGALTVALPDYCNNPSDAWQIIFDNEISMCKPRKGDDVWNCFNRNCDFSFVENLTYHQNPLRAAMIVFLKMQEAKRG